MPHRVIKNRIIEFWAKKKEEVDHQNPLVVFLSTENSILKGNDIMLVEKENREVSS